MEEYEQAVFISYAWGDEREEIVNQIGETLQKRGITIIRDKRDLEYKGSINAFMEHIGQGSCVIVVISDKYLRSPNCMFELVEIAENKGFHDRIFPVVLADADIYDPVRRVEYIKYWEAKRAELAEAIKSVDPANLQGIREDMDLYDRIRDKISELTSILKDMNTLTPDRHRNSDFSDLYDIVTKRIRSIAFSPDGKYLVSGSRDYTVRVRSVESGNEVTRIIHDERVNSAVFSPDGRYIVLGGEDNDVRVWIWRPGDLHERACARLTRNLTLEEWEQYLGDEPYQLVCPNLSPEPEVISTGTP